MRASQAFVLGAFMGAAAVWLWGRQMEEYVGEKTEFLQDTKEHVSETLRAGQDAIRPASAKSNTRRGRRTP